MDIRGAALDGIEQHLVDEPHQGRVVGVLTEHGAGGLVLGVGDQGLQLDIVQPAQHAGDIIVLLIQEARYPGAQFVVLGDHQVDRGTRLEADLGERTLVGRIADRHAQSPAVQAQRQRQVTGHQLAVDGVARAVLEIDGVDIDRRQAELVGGGLGDLGGTEDAGIDQVLDQRNLVPCSFLDRGTGGTFVQQALGDQPSGQAAQDRGAHIHIRVRRRVKNA